MSKCVVLIYYAFLVFHYKMFYCIVPHYFFVIRCGLFFKSCWNSYALSIFFFAIAPNNSPMIFPRIPSRILIVVPFENIVGLCPRIFPEIPGGILLRIIHGISSSIPLKIPPGIPPGMHSGLPPELFPESTPGFKPSLASHEISKVCIRYSLRDFFRDPSRDFFIDYSRDFSGIPFGFFPGIPSTICSGIPVWDSYIGRSWVSLTLE